MDGKLPEMELEKLDSLLELLKLRADDQLMMIGQINYINEESISVEVNVSTFADYNGSPILMSWKEEVGRERLPKDEKDTEAITKVKELEKRIQDKKQEIKTIIEKAEFDTEFGVWK